MRGVVGSTEVNATRKSLIAFVAADSVAVAAVTAPTAAEARWRGWGWGAALGGFTLGAVVGSSLARPYYGYPSYGYSYYGYPAYYSYGYPAYYSYGYYPRRYYRRHYVYGHW
jgi:hypothetical protein